MYMQKIFFFYLGSYLVMLIQTGKHLYFTFDFDKYI
jgi:hypothetical protein